MDRNELWRHFSEIKRAFGTRRAISTPQTDLTFEDLYKAAEELALRLGHAGARTGDIIALSLPNSLAFVPALLALVRLSAVVALVSPLYRERELRTIMEGVQPACLLLGPGLAERWLQAIEAERTETIALPGVGELVLAFPARPSSTQPAGVGMEARLPGGDGAALIKFSSGSTGIPKGVVLTADNLLAEARNVVATLAVTGTDCIYAPVPIFHSYGFDLGVLPMLTAGAQLVLREAFVPRRVLADISQREVSLFLGVPSIYRTFVETPLAAVPDLSHIRYLLSCTAPLHPDLIAAFHEKFRMQICQHYGSSETGAATTHDPAQVLAHPTSVGLPMANVQLLILDEHGRELEAGEEGEVVVKSKVVAAGYLMGQPAGEPKFVEDTFRTGDIGCVDLDGFLYLKGRLDDVINVGGLKVSPSEVVQVLETFPAVREAAVVGVQDAAGEEFVYAVVTLKRGATEQEILQHCQGRLSVYKVPRRIQIREEMPRGPSGKIKLDPKDMPL
jgi:long-chain acyl-CoA synthetase